MLTAFQPRRLSSFLVDLKAGTLLNASVRGSRKALSIIPKYLRWARFRAALVFAVAIFEALSSIFAQDGPDAASANSKPPPLQQVAPDVFQLGQVRLNKAQKTIQFPAKLNINQGLIEYLIVSSHGKTYESLLRTDANPFEIQLAMLLIGAAGAPQTPELLAASSTPFHVNAAGTNQPPALVPVGDRIAIEFSWKTNETLKRAAGESWVWNLATKTNAAPGSWIYNGSRVVKGTFIAQRDGSIVATIDDIDAMVNNPRPGHDNDQIWQIVTNGLPPLETPVDVTFRLEKNAK
jgi:hypothetical protein